MSPFSLINHILVLEMLLSVYTAFTYCLYSINIHKCIKFDIASQSQWLINTKNRLSALKLQIHITVFSIYDHVFFANESDFRHLTQKTSETMHTMHLRIINQAFLLDYNCYY